MSEQIRLSAEYNQRVAIIAFALGVRRPKLFDSSDPKINLI